MMELDAMMDILKKFGIYSQKDFIRQAFSRNIGLLTLEEQDRLSKARVAIPGMGGVGGVHLITLARTGIGKFNIADFDVFEPANVNRQFGARVPDFGRKKLDVMKEQALSVNPYLELNLFEEGIQDKNMDGFLDGVDVVVDGLDFFQFEVRRNLFKKAAEKGIYVVTAGPMGYSSAMLVFDPKGMGFDEYFNITASMADKDKYLSFALGLSPRPTHIQYMNLKKVNLESRAGPSLNAACQICAGMAATETIRILLKKKGLRCVPCFVQFDPYLMKLQKGRLLLGNKNPIQKVKMKIVNLILEKNKVSNTDFQEPEKPDFNKCAEKKMIPMKIVEYLVRAGIQAPSGDNAQPWNFVWTMNSIKVFLDRKADESFFNIHQIASIISCGAVVENIKIAAADFGIKTVVNYLPDKKNDDLVAEVQLDCVDSAPKDPLFDFIWKRKTNRKFYHKHVVPLSILTDVQGSISALPGTAVCFVTEPDKLKHLARLIYSVDQIRTQNRSLHEHLNKMIRFSENDTVTKRDGLPLKNLEAGLAGELFLKATKPWQIMNVLNKSGISKMAAFHSYKGIVNSSGAALVTVDGLDPISFLKGGRALERIWLTLTLSGYSVQPMTAITLFWLRWLLRGKDDFSDGQQRLLADTWKDFQNMFAEVNFNENGLVMLFRFGKSDEISCGTLRKGLLSFVRSSSEY